MASLEDLIKTGEEIEKQASPGAYGIGTILSTSKEFEEWAARSVMYIENNCKSKSLIDKVTENAKDLTSNGFEKHQAILGVLKSLNP